MFVFLCSGGSIVPDLSAIHICSVKLQCGEHIIAALLLKMPCDGIQRRRTNPFNLIHSTMNMHVRNSTLHIASRRVAESHVSLLIIYE